MARRTPIISIYDISAFTTGSILYYVLCNKYNIIYQDIQCGNLLSLQKAIEMSLVLAMARRTTEFALMRLLH